MYVNVNNISVFCNAKELRGKGLVRDELLGLSCCFCFGLGFFVPLMHTQRRKKVYTAKLPKLSRFFTRLLRVFLAIVK